MNYETKFKEIYEDFMPLKSGTKAFVYELPVNTNNPFKAVSGKIPKGARVTMKNRVVYVLAEEFTHPDAIQLSI